MSVSYKYDALGRRVQRTPSTGVSTNYLYDGQDVVKDIQSDGSTIEYLNGPGVDNKLRQVSSTTGTLYYQTDHLGSTRVLTDASGNIVERVSYDSFGNGTGSTRTRYAYTGRERDELTGLYYYRARWYDPQVGRFISEDPIGFEGGVNWYAYVENDPVNYTDPLGLQKDNRFHGDLDSLCNGDCEDIKLDIAKIEASIATRSAELSRRRQIGLPLDSGHTGRLAKERRTLERCRRRYREMGCDKQNCPPTPIPVSAPLPNPSPTPSAKRRSKFPVFDLGPGVLVPTVEQRRAINNAAAAGSLPAVVLLLLILATAP